MVTSITAEPDYVYDADPIEEGNPEEESLFDLAEASAEPDPAPLYLQILPVRLKCPYCPNLLTPDETVEYQRSGQPCQKCVQQAMDEMHRYTVIEEFCSWYPDARRLVEAGPDPDREAYEAGRYIVTATGGR